jgi:hypothetical protein
MGYKRRRERPRSLLTAISNANVRETAYISQIAVVENSKLIIPKQNGFRFGKISVNSRFFPAMARQACLSLSCEIRFIRLTGIHIIPVHF